MCKYLMKWKNENGYEAYETYDSEGMKPLEHAKMLLYNFNKSLRPYESIRTLLSVSTNIIISDEIYIKNDPISLNDKIELNKLNGYLNPNGYYHKEIGFMQHCSWATGYCEKHNIDPRSEDNIYGLEEDWLQKHGWIKFSVTNFGVYVFTQSHVTKGAIRWFEEHINEIDIEQVIQFERLIKLYKGVHYSKED